MNRENSFFSALAAAAVLALTAAPAPALAQSPRGSATPECSPRALPRAEGEAMQREYDRRTDEDGKASADAWLKGAARAFFARLVDQGICTMPGTTEREVATNSAPERKVVRGKDGTPCKRTRLANRAVAGLGGGPMTMALVPVCAD